MKIEIDFNRPESLRKQKRELEMALATVIGALKALDKNEGDAAQPSFPQIVDAALRDEAESLAVLTNYDQTVSDIIEKMPKEFNMRQAKIEADTAGVPDSRLRRVISRLIESGDLELVEKGQGRRPASFRKA